MSYKFKRCESEHRLFKISVNTAYVEKEITEAKKDLESAKRFLTYSDLKWATITSYFSMFHAFRSLLFLAGYDEKGHDCLIIAIEDLFVHKSLLPRSIIQLIRDAKDSRESADYGLTYSDENARKSVSDAEEVYDIIVTYLVGEGIRVD
jgi:uncharacterized protein (UPF0332 family)